jgi:hypothetical protein
MKEKSRTVPPKKFKLTLYLEAPHSFEELLREMYKKIKEMVGGNYHSTLPQSYFTKNEWEIAFAEYCIANGLHKYFFIEQLEKLKLAKPSAISEGEND